MRAYAYKFIPTNLQIIAWTFIALYDKNKSSPQIVHQSHEIGQKSNKEPERMETLLIWVPFSLVLALPALE